MSQKPILFYHGNCPDGFGAAFSFWMKYRDTIDYVPLHNNYLPFNGLTPNDYLDRDVWMVDVALKRSEIIELNKQAKSFQLLDHHDSNRIELEDLDYCHFDLTHSGAVLAWKYCFPNESIPLLLQYIEARDIHTWNLPYANEILAAIDSYEKTFESWERLNQELDSSIGFSKLLSEGEPILRYMQVLMSRIKNGVFKIKICGYEVPVINTPFFRPEILNDLAKGEPFSAGYDYDGQDFIFSLRSDENGLKVSDIAKKFRGGGHPHAAGFRVRSLSELNKEE